MPGRARGRPRGHPETRRRIAELAGPLFRERGYRGTTLRAVAAAAGVDAALIGYHFGSKQRLFAECMRMGRTPSEGLAAALPGDPAGLADRILRAVTEVWEDPSLTGELPELARAAMRDEPMFREYLDQEVAGRLAEHLGGPRSTQRAAAAVAVIAGVILTRYLSPLPATAALPADELRRHVAPALHAALFGTPPRHRP